MSTSTITPPDVTMPQQSLPDLGQATPQAPTYDPSQEQQTDNDLSGQQSGGGSRLSKIISAVSSTLNTGLAGIPDKGRPSFATGLGQGARAAQAANQQQAEYKFKSFQDQVRLAQLHNEDVRQQNADEDHQNQVDQQAQNQVQRNTDAYDLNYQFIPNNPGGQEVLNHFKSQMAQNGQVGISPLIISSPKGWYIPTDDSTKQSKAMSADYNSRAQFYGLSPTPAGQPVTHQAYDVLRNMSNGFDPSGQPMHADQIQARVDTMNANLDAYKKKPNADPKTIAAIQQDADHLQSLQQIVKQRDDDAVDNATQQAAAKAKALSDATLGNKEALQNNAAANKPQKTQNTDWVPGATADEKKKAELAENMTYNVNSVASLLQRRPDLVGAVAGRFTSLDQMAGSNDPDIVQLATDIHNIGMANAGIHGLRSLDAANDYGKVVLNNFKNGPAGIYGGLKSSVDSVQTFIDNARPKTYKTHSSQGGAVRAMVPQQQVQQ